MCLLKNILITSMLLSMPSLVAAAEKEKIMIHAENKMQFPNDVNGDVFRRMQSSGFDFSKPHDVEYFAVFRTEEEAVSVAKQYVADHKAGDKLKNIETKPAESGGMELQLVKTMLVTYENVTTFESNLADRVSKHDGYLDGWGVLQQ